MTTESGVVLVFAKAPRPGRVKTRMVPPLTPSQAAELYAKLLADVLSTTAEFARELGLRPVVAVNPPEACREIAQSAPSSFCAVAQRGADLSQRMTWAVREAAATGAARVLLRGSDSPVLSGEMLRDTLEALEGSDLVVCPDRDGGYSLIGLRQPVPGLFEHPMSTSSVLEQTLANAARLGLSARVLAPSFDLDRIEDLRCLAQARADGNGHLCGNTLAYLDANALWRYVPP